MEFKKTLGIMLLAGAVAIGSGCAGVNSNQSLSRSHGKAIWVRPTAKQNIRTLLDRQRGDVGYSASLSGRSNFLSRTAFNWDGGESYSVYEDCAYFKGHVFGTRIIDRGGNDYDISVFADNVILNDLNGDGNVDSGDVVVHDTIDCFERDFIIKGYVGNHVSKNIPVPGGGSNPLANGLQNAVLELVVGGMNGRDAIRWYNRAKEKLFGSMFYKTSEGGII